MIEMGRVRVVASIKDQGMGFCVRIKDMTQ